MSLNNIIKTSNAGLQLKKDYHEHDAMFEREKTQF